MLSRRNLVLRSVALVLAGLGAVAVQSQEAEAGGFFRRMFGYNNCQNCYQQVPVQQAPATTTATAPAGSYQSNSFEPGAAAPAVVAPAAPTYNVPMSNRPSHEQFRGDRKALGKY